MEWSAVGAVPQETRLASQCRSNRITVLAMFWGTPITAGEYTFIGHPRGRGKVLMLTAN